MKYLWPGLLLHRAVVRTHGIKCQYLFWSLSKCIQTYICHLYLIRICQRQSFGVWKFRSCLCYLHLSLHNGVFGGQFMSYSLYNKTIWGLQKNINQCFSTYDSFELVLHWQHSFLQFHSCLSWNFNFSPFSWFVS